MDASLVDGISRRLLVTVLLHGRRQQQRGDEPSHVSPPAREDQGIVDVVERVLRLIALVGRFRRNLMEVAHEPARQARLGAADRGDGDVERVERTVEGEMGLGQHE